MKILAIRGCNLASLDGDFEVDFRSEPLCSAGIFAITGNTGAGKTTILDAMCIALYHDSPRLENVVAKDKIDPEFTVANIKSIMRKGKANCYAEVDFLAVDGNEYRTRWSVARAYNKVTGRLQDAQWDIFNLSTGEEYRKMDADEHLGMINRLVGLEFNQFTRAVLLAQGNFSAFLKAKDSEKANMLSALTDTGIYSQISIGINNKWKKAVEELEIIEAKRGTLQLLSRDEIAEYKEKLISLNKEQKDIEKCAEVLKTKHEWITRLVLINKQIELAEKQLAEAKEKLAQVEHEKKKLKLIDSVQPIRDDYMSLRETRQQTVNYGQQLQVLEKKLGEMSAGYDKAISAVKDADEQQARINAENKDAQPRILEASQLEKQCTNDKQLHAGLVAEVKRSGDAHGKYIAEIGACDKKSATLLAEQKEIAAWVEQHAHYSNAIPLIPSIIINLTSIAEETKMVQTNEKSLSKYQELLAVHEKHLVAAHRSEEALKQTMSSEIAVLRKRLVEGEPCPVCGSKNHAAVEIAANLLEEKELEKAKEENRRLIEQLETDTANCRTEIEKLRSIIEIHKASIAQSKSVNLSYLSGVKDAAELLENSNAATILNTLAANWEKYKTRLESITNELAMCRNDREGHLVRAEEIKKELEEKSNRLHLLEEEMKTHNAQLTSILGKWKTANEMQQHYNDAVSNANRRFSEATKKKAEIEIELNKLRGEISGKKQQLDDATGKTNKLLAIVNGFLASRDDNMDVETLEALLQISHTTIAAMRNNIGVAEKAATTAEATIGERRQVLAAHNNAPIRPQDGEDAVSIKEQLTTLEVQYKDGNRMLAEISALLLKDDENKKQFARYNEEYEYKKEEKKQWEILYKLFGSSKGDTLMKAAQEYTLDILLNVANIHLAEMTKRYKLARICDGSLGIKVIDLDMMAESRSAHSLSGGETFIVSLALSLALSSLSSNRMRIESLFIDEGFGALDKETLQTAVMMLEKLQLSGRKIGVISHLPEMLEQIPVKVNVVRLSPGRSKIEINDNRK